MDLEDSGLLHVAGFDLAKQRIRNPRAALHGAQAVSAANAQASELMREFG